VTDAAGEVVLPYAGGFVLGGWNDPGSEDRAARLMRVDATGHINECP